ncbi:MAG: CopD family protein [Myxococcales bacterium]|nr:CopD family protein [Myxococcales bacterium]
MTGLPSLLISAHVIGDLLWIGSICATALILGDADSDPKERGRIAYRVYQRLANPGFVLAFVAGLTQLVMKTEYYFVTTKFMHAKLLFALIVIGLHHVIGARAKKMAQGKVSEPGPAPAMGWGVLVLAAVTAVVAVLKPF